MNIKQCFVKLARKMIFFSLACLLCGCNLSDNNDFGNTEQWSTPSINYFIDKQNKNYADIYELACVPANDASLLGDDCDLLKELINLKKIKLVGIANEYDAQKIFSELSRLKNLNTVEIEESHIGMIDKLGEIENLNNLSIIGSSGGGTWYTIKDLYLLGVDSRFNKLQTLTLKYINLESIPNLSELPNLHALSISGYDIKDIDANAINWNNLVSLEISSTAVATFDNSIIERLYKLQSINISYGRICDVKFVLDLPNLKRFLYAGHSLNNVDMECLKSHPNYTEEWLVD